MSKEDDEMKLPKGKQCINCAHCTRCVSMFGVKTKNVVCDFYPSRFKDKDD